MLTDANAKGITRVEELAYDLRINRVMSRGLQYLTPDTRMIDALELFRTNRISGAPVLDDGKLLGIVSMEDLIRALCDFEQYAVVGRYMSRHVLTVRESDPVIEAIQLFTKTGVGRLPVVDDNDKVVGMITKGDITRGVLNALQNDIQEEEMRRYRASHLFEDIVSDRTSLILRYTIKARDFTRGGHASANIKRALVRLGATPQIARRCGIAVYEAEINLIIHTLHGGTLRVQIDPKRILMNTVDDGPGIPDIDMAMQPGYSTATEEVRAMGFGAGMGLVNMQRCVDRLKLESMPGQGTRLEMEIQLSPAESFREGKTSEKEDSA